MLPFQPSHLISLYKHQTESPVQQRNMITWSSFRFKLSLMRQIIYLDELIIFRNTETNKSGRFLLNLLKHNYLLRGLAGSHLWCEEGQELLLLLKGQQHH